MITDDCLPQGKYLAQRMFPTLIRAFISQLSSGQGSEL
jgi:hypothetical protein